MEYFVEDIVYKNGQTRTDGRYPKRIGSTIRFLTPIIIGEPCMFRYIKYNNGEVDEDHITRTSVIDDYDNYSVEGKMFLYTRNSIYILRELAE